MKRGSGRFGRVVVAIGRTACVVALAVGPALTAGCGVADHTIVGEAKPVSITVEDDSSSAALSDGDEEEPRPLPCTFQQAGTPTCGAIGEWLTLGWNGPIEPGWRVFAVSVEGRMVFGRMLADDPVDAPAGWVMVLWDGEDTAYNVLPAHLYPVHVKQN